MSKVILDPELRGKLNGLNEPVEVCEPTGETVGHFVPEEAPRETVEELTAFFSEEDGDRR